MLKFSDFLFGVLLEELLGVSLGVAALAALGVVALGVAVLGVVLGVAALGVALGVGFGVAVFGVPLGVVLGVAAGVRKFSFPFCLGVLGLFVIAFGLLENALRGGKITNQLPLH